MKWKHLKNWHSSKFEKKARKSKNLHVQTLIAVGVIVSIFIVLKILESLLTFSVQLLSTVFINDIKLLLSTKMKLNCAWLE